MTVALLKSQLKSLQQRHQTLLTMIDYDTKKKRIHEIDEELMKTEVWSNQNLVSELSKERTQILGALQVVEQLGRDINDNTELLAIATSEHDDGSIADIQNEVNHIETALAKAECQRMFNRKMDAKNAYLDIQAGSGGTEAQDWAEMLLRMYLRWCDNEHFKATVVNISAGDVAGIKGATVHVSGDYAFGWLRSETGIHRLVRKSPFDSGNRRHTSFASVFISPEIDDTVTIDINPSEVRTDTYRASGAGGQHVNKTDSAVRLTHLPTNTVVQCQNARSQHQNREQAWKMLKARLYELEDSKQRQQKQTVEEQKSDITWGNQIRSYILDDARIKDLRTGHESRNTQSVLDGDLTPFIEASLKAGV